MKKIIVLCVSLLMINGCLASWGSTLGTQAIINITEIGIVEINDYFEEKQWRINQQYSDSGVNLRELPIENIFSLEDLEDENSN